jgi:penicillin-insensitive murein endopeptidase
MSPRLRFFPPSRPESRALALAAGLLAASLAGAWDDVATPAPGPAEAIGRYAAGCMIGAAALPVDGPGYQAVDLARNRHYGHPELVRFVEDLGERAADRGLGLLAIGDLSQPQGGPMLSAHASHQIGLDVDVYLRVDLPRLPAAEREDLDLPSFVDRGPQRVNARFGTAQAELLRIAASDARVARVFVHPAIKLDLCGRDWPDRAFLRTVRPWFGHDDHLHVRLNCPPGSTECVAQPPPPDADGCGAELASWFERGPVPARAPGVRRPPELPARCEALR